MILTNVELEQQNVKTSIGNNYDQTVMFRNDENTVSQTAQWVNALADRPDAPSQAW